MVQQWNAVLHYFDLCLYSSTNLYDVSPSRSRYDAFMFSFAAGHPRELEIQPSGEVAKKAEAALKAAKAAADAAAKAAAEGKKDKEGDVEEAGVHKTCLLVVLHERTGMLSDHLSDWIKGSALRALKAADAMEGGDMNEVLTADVPEWFQLSHLRWSGKTTAVKMEAGHLLIPYGCDDCQTLILDGEGRISPCAAIVDARAAVKERKKKEGEMRATRVKQELEMAIQGTEGHGGRFFVAERREDGVVRPNEMNRNTINSIQLLCV